MLYHDQVTMMEADIETLQMHVDLLQKQLAAMTRERDKYRATVISLAGHNKVLEQELIRSRKGNSGKEEKYVDTRLQVQDLREALEVKDNEIEELQKARDYMPTSDAELVRAYQRMREVFESLRSTLSCSLCYDIFSANDVLTLECGHTMCSKCLTEWSNTRHRLYNLTTTPECPECRLPGKHYVKVYLLEEVVRTVNRLDRLESEARRDKNNALWPLNNILRGSSPVSSDEDAPSLLLERARHRYASASLNRATNH